MRSHPADIKRANINEENRQKYIKVQAYIEKANGALLEASRIARDIEDPNAGSVAGFLESDLRVLAPTSQAVRFVLEGRALV
jgi:hypothetical protein